MPPLFSYRDERIYCHHSLDPEPDPTDFQIHAHETPEVYCFLSGRASYLVEGVSYALSPGDILLLRPAETHKLLLEPGMAYERVAVHFPENLFDALDPERRLLRPFFERPLGQRNRYSAREHPDCFRLLSELRPAPGLERMQIAGRLLALLGDLSAVFEAERGTGAPERTGLHAQLVGYVNRHLFEALSLDRLCLAFARSPSQVGRLFRESTGTSFWEYVTIKRLLAARAMIQRGDSAMYAAETCGFSDYSAFFRAYKKRFGRAPSEDRGG